MKSNTVISGFTARLSLLSVLPLLWAGTAAAQTSPVGHWQIAGDDSVVEIHACNAEEPHSQTLCATVRGTVAPIDAVNGVPAHCGLQLLAGFKPVPRSQLRDAITSIMSGRLVPDLRPGAVSNTQRWQGDVIAPDTSKRYRGELQPGLASGEWALTVSVLWGLVSETQRLVPVTDFRRCGA